MEKTRLAVVVDGEGPNLNEQRWLPPTSVLSSTSTLKIEKRCDPGKMGTEI